MTTEMLEMDEFDVLLNDVLRTVANPELPERVRVKVQTRVWVREMTTGNPTSGKKLPDMGHPLFLVQMSPKRDSRSTGAAVLMHIAAIALLFWAVQAHSRLLTLGKTTAVSELTTPPPIAPAKGTMGGGGGQRGAAPVSQGHLPKFADRQITVPKAPPMEEPKIRMPDAAIEVQKDLKMTNNAMPNIGMPNSPLVGKSMGNGLGSGLGSGSGAGLGPGSGGNYSGGLRKVGGGVSRPELISKIDPEFSEDARRAKFMGVVTVNLIVDQNGMPQNVHILRGVGMGLDDKAVAAVKQYRFKPAKEGGKPVAVEINVEVNFQIF